MPGRRASQYWFIASLRILQIQTCLAVDSIDCRVTYHLACIDQRRDRCLGPASWLTSGGQLGPAATLQEATNTVMPYLGGWVPEYLR